MSEHPIGRAPQSMLRFIAAAVVLLSVAACGGGGGGVGGGTSSSSPTQVLPPPSPTPTGTAPTVSLSASQTTVNSGGSANLQWSVTKATSCTASGGWSGTKTVPSGSEAVGPLTDTKSFIMTCTGAGGTTVQSVTVAVLKPSQPPPLGSTIVSVNFQNRSSSAAADLPVTFGQAFVRGDVPSGATLVARTTGSGSQSVPIQLDEIATHADGSLRYAVISTRVPSLAAGAAQAIELVSAAPGASAAPVALSDLLNNSSYDVVVSLNVGGVVYSASARDLLQAGPVTTWLQGPLVTEWMVSAPVKTASGTAHPHLAVRFNVRAYAGMDSVRTDVIVENDWAYEPNPQNYPYTVTITMGGATVYTKTLTHYSQSRWRKIFWWGRDPQVDVRFDKRYLLASGALPNFDQTLTIPDSVLASLASDWTNADTGPMGAGLAEPVMPAAGGRQDIGPLARWDALYLLSGDPRAESASLGSGDLAGSWPIHYRDQNTGLPVSLNDYPYMTILGNVTDTRNPATGQLEAFPTCGGDCSTPFDPDSAHQPSLVYLPYLVTGDQYYLEELQFWTTWNALHSNPYYRDFDKGLAKWDQIRGQAWTMRTLGQAAYITPDANPLKSYFVGLLQNNLDWYNANFSNNASANNFGILTSGVAIVYNSNRGVAPWQDDFFTWSIGYLAGMGFSDASPLLAWKAKFPVGRMTDPGFCWISGAAYSVNIRDDASSPLYTTFAQIYDASIDPAVTSTVCASDAMATALGLSVGEMTGFAYSPEGYPSNMQPALAVAVDSGIANSGAAWSVFVNQSVKPDYSSEPNFDIVPR